MAEEQNPYDTQPLQILSDEVQRLYERTDARFTAADFDRFQAPTALDAALDHIDDAVRALTAESDMSNDVQTASMLLAYAVNVAMGRPSPEFLAALDQRQIDPAVAHTLARAVTSLALAVVAWARDTPPPASEALEPTSHTQG
jgi:hypothetical protein